jgi:acetyl-CoA carboxylase biotin carboxyl carrier protein
MKPVDNLKSKVDELADLMDKFQLSQAELSGQDWRVAFKKRSAARPMMVAAEGGAMVEAEDRDEVHVESAPDTPAIPAGTPVNSPMNGIYYSSSSPSAPPFVKEGEPVNAGQVVGLIEAMKVFNEIVAPTSGRVTKIMTTNGQIVNPGDVLLYIA